MKLRYRIKCFESNGPDDVYFYLRAPADCDQQAFDFIVSKMKSVGFVFDKLWHTEANPKYEDGEDCSNGDTGWAMKWVRRYTKKMTKRELGI